MNIDVNLEEVKEFVESESFISFLMDNTTDLGIAAYILQTLTNSINKDLNGENKYAY